MAAFEDYYKVLVKRKVQPNLSVPSSPRMMMIVYMYN